MISRSSKVIYIIGPYSKGDQTANVRRAILYADHLRSQGHIPFCPHLSMFWHLVSHHPYEYWLELSIDMLKAVLPDEVHRLDGESSGSDKEEEQCKMFGLPVIQTDWQP